MSSKLESKTATQYTIQPKKLHGINSACFSGFDILIYCLDLNFNNVKNLWFELFHFVCIWQRRPFESA